MAWFACHRSTSVACCYTGCVVQIGEPGGDHVRNRTGGEHGETDDVQCAAEESGCESRHAEAVKECKRE
jgi:hypothetical protein